MTAISMRTRFLSIAVTLMAAISLALAPMSAYASGSPDIAAYEWDGSTHTASADKKSPLSAQDTSLSAQASMSKLGIDVSEWQKTIIWSQVKNQVSYAIVRCGYGSNQVSQDDKYWLPNIRGCIENNIPFGVYLYSYATNKTDAQSEADHVIRLLQQAGLSQADIALPIYIDIEDPSERELPPELYAAIFNTFKARLNNAGYSKVGIYASASWWEYRFTQITLASEYRWVAHWADVFGDGYPNTRLTGCGIWQYSSSGSISGISGNVDVNKARDDLSFLQGNDPDTSYIFRLFNSYSGEHLFTTSADEVGALEKHGWTYEGLAYRAPKSGDTPVYRLFNPYTGDHHYTTSKAEYDQCMQRGWSGEGTAFYSAPSIGTKIYRLYNPYATTGTHHYTTSYSEYASCIYNGWRGEGVGWYGK